MNTALKYYGPAILWALFILIICSIKLGKIGSSPMFFPGFDKLVHCGLFFVLVILCSSGFIRQQSRGILTYKSLILIAVIAIMYGGVIELLQRYIFTWRSGEWDDLFADAVGACMGTFSLIITIKAMTYVKK